MDYPFIKLRAGEFGLCGKYLGLPKFYIILDFSPLSTAESGWD